MSGCRVHSFYFVYGKLVHRVFFFLLPILCFLGPFIGSANGKTSLASQPVDCKGITASDCYDKALAQQNIGNDKKALEYAKLACEENEGQACFFVGVELESGKHVEDAISFYKKACDHNFETACENYADLMMSKEKVKRQSDYTSFYKRACDAKMSKSACKKLDIATGNVKKSEEKAHVAGMEANLFYKEKGTWSENLIGKKMTLWNTIIGEGDAKSPSDSMFVKVRFEGVGLGSSKVKVQIREVGGKTFVNETTSVSLGNKVEFLSYYLKEIGCAPVEISAEVVGDSAKMVKNTVGFACGE